MQILSPSDLKISSKRPKLPYSTIITPIKQRQHTSHTTKNTHCVSKSAVNTTQLNHTPTIHRPTSPDQGTAALDGITTLILDCDGVLWQGNRLLPKTQEALQSFRNRGFKLLFLTNNSSKSRLQYQHKFQAMQLYVEPHEIVPSSYCAAAYLQSIDFNSTVLLVGGEGVAAELEDAGIAYKYCPTSSDPGQWDVASGFKSMEIDHDIGAVVVGFDEQFSYEKICRASAHLREGGGGGGGRRRRRRASQDDDVHTNNSTKETTSGCLFVATNMDNYDNMGNGRMMPGTGCLVAAIERVADRQAVNVGKGGDWLLPFLLHQYGLKPEETCIVGDRLDTDIALGKVGGLRSVLTLTGVTTEEDLRVAGDDEVPDYVVPHLALLAGLEWE